MGILQYWKALKTQTAARQQNTNLRDRLKRACHHKQNQHQLQDQIHLITKFKGSVVESENSPSKQSEPPPPCSNELKQSWAILDLGQHYRLGDSICPFLCDGSLLFYSILLTFFQQPHSSRACVLGLYENIVPTQYKWKCFFPTQSSYTVI